MKKKGKILFFCMIFVTGNVSAQQNQLQSNTAKAFISSYYKVGVPFNVQTVNKPLLDPRFYVNNMGFFCKQELKLQRLTLLPVKFRLGSVSYCNRMEGKLNAGLVSAY